MKQIDKLLLGSFLGPFIVSFAVALFVLIMQFLWLYIDEIAGKGVSIFIMLELLGYMSVSTFPMALPIAVLVASVMVMGNLSERYELSSLKSAGVSLLRIMAPLMVICTAIACFSFACSDFLIPASNLKFRSRLFDIRKQKPALSIEKGTFNEDFQRFVIRVGEKEKDNETIGNVIIEDQSNGSRAKFNQILADSGQMYISTDKRFFVMNLFGGAQYQEPSANGGPSKQKYPFVRTEFKSWKKVWDMAEFDINLTDEDRFSRQRSMLTINQLKHSLDSLEKMMYNGRQGMAEDFVANLKRQPLLKATQVKAITDSLDKITRGTVNARIAELSGRAASSTARKLPVPKPAVLPSPIPPLPPGTPVQDSAKMAQQQTDFIATFPATLQKKLLEDALKHLQQSFTTLENRKKQVSDHRLEWAKTGYELYTKHSFAIVCLLFLFIGGPLGAIIRKGGFGYSILIAIVFFVTFVFLNILCRKLAESFVLSPFWAAMMPCLVLVPIAASLTWRAMNDIELFSTERLERAWRWLSKRFQSKQAQPVQPS